MCAVDIYAHADQLLALLKFVGNGQITLHIADTKVKNIETVTVVRQKWDDGVDKPMR